MTSRPRWFRRLAAGQIEHIQVAIVVDADTGFREFNEVILKREGQPDLPVHYAAVTGVEHISKSRAVIIGLHFVRIDGVADALAK
jgi:hypothetical protein